MEEKFRFDTHLHTWHSPCSSMSPIRLVEQAVETGLDAIVVCDHNTSRGAIDAQRHAIRSQLPINVILGIEASTGYGELGLKFLSEQECSDIEKIKNHNGQFAFPLLKEVIDDLRSKGSQLLVDLHHPFSLANGNKRGGFHFDGIIRSENNITGIFENMEDFMRWIDFTEFNTSNLSAEEGDQALALARKFNKPIVCSTDAHFPWQVGKFYSSSREKDPRIAIVNNLVEFSPPPVSKDYLTARANRTLSGIIKPIRKFIGPLGII